MKPWNNIPKNYDYLVGFVYEIIEKNTGMKYIGITRFWEVNKIKPNKWERVNGKCKLDKKGNKIPILRTSKIHIKKETDWENYCGSNKTLQKNIKKHPDNYIRNIIKCWDNLTDLKAHEAYLQLKAYFDGEWNNYYNEHIGLKLRIRK